MGNIIRLSIARLGLSFNSIWNYKARSRAKSSSIVILILGSEAVGKTTIASRIVQKKEFDDYVPTKGFNFYKIPNGQRGSIKIYDLGGSTSVRDLWTHYYPDAHGIIYVIDSAEVKLNLASQSEIFAQTLRDERIRRKPLLIMANKRDLPTAKSLNDILTQAQIGENVNKAKCITRLDVTSKENIDGVEDGLITGFKWLLSEVRKNWSELNDRVVEDSLVEKTKNRAANLKKPRPEKIKDDNKDELILSASDLEAELFKKRICLKRLDPEGGNEKNDSVQNEIKTKFKIESEGEEELSEVLIVGTKVEVHHPRSQSASYSEHSRGIFSASFLNESQNFRGAKSAAPSSKRARTSTELKSKEKNGGNEEIVGMKLFRNKTAPMPNA